MKIFVTGATGALGGRVLPLLLAQGHSPVGLCRSEINRRQLEQAGAEPRTASLFDADSLARATVDCETILHLATAIPTKPRTSAKDWQENDRIRRAGTAALLKAAVQNRCRLFVQQSITFLIGDHRGQWVDESHPVPSCQPLILRSAPKMEQLARRAADAHDLPCVTIRFGSFYSRDSIQSQALFKLAQQPCVPIIGSGNNYWNTVRIDDAARAVAAVVDNHRGQRHLTVNACDHDPPRYGDLVKSLRSCLGGGRVIRLPAWTGRAIFGAPATPLLSQSARCRNELIHRLFHWSPAPSSGERGYLDEATGWLKLTSPQHTNVRHEHDDNHQ